MQSQPANHEITGYMPNRWDFETEFENDAETVIKELNFDELEEGPIEQQEIGRQMHGHPGRTLNCPYIGRVEKVHHGHL